MNHSLTKSTQGKCNDGFLGQRLWLPLSRLIHRHYDAKNSSQLVLFMKSESLRGRKHELQRDKSPQYYDDMNCHHNLYIVIIGLVCGKFSELMSEVTSMEFKPGRDI